MEISQQSRRLKEFKRTVTNKFALYNSLFLSLPFGDVKNVGKLLPLLTDQCEQGLSEGKSPQEILEVFFTNFADLEDPKERIDLMFKIIQYVERQVVLYDSVEDAAFPKLQRFTDSFSIKDYLKLVEENENRGKIREKLATFSARIVLTAHPTQFYTPDILDIIKELRTLIDNNQVDAIDITLQQLGLTSLVNAKKPTPLKEARNIIHILRYTYYDAIGDLFQHIKSNIHDETFDNYDLIKLGFWPGGDRDGNPFVTAKTTRKVANELRTNIMKCYYNDLKALSKKLTFPGLRENMKTLTKKLYDAMFDPKRIVSYEEIIERLSEMKKDLIEDYHGLYLEELNAFIDKVHIFKTHFATLDIREDHSKHHLAVQSILMNEGVIKESLDELSQEELIKCLIENEYYLDAEDYDEERVVDIIENIQQLKMIQYKNGEEGCNRYIISNSEDVFSVLFVFGLFRWSGLKVEEISFDIVPLFETMVGMENSEAVMNALLELPIYRKHIQRRHEKQTIMLGFSDGTKDGGYLKANWSILKTKKTLSKVCSDHKIKAIFFDGRGGPPARGGGKTHRFYASQTNAVANHEIQLTIQGQTITSTYGTTEQFMHNAEQLLTAGLSNNIPGKEHVISEEQSDLIEELSNISFEKYDALKQHEKFIPYLEQRSTLNYYKQANIGSRPGKRGKKDKLTLTDLRAISFVGSWNQLKQNVPGYFGLGTAIKNLADQGRMDEVKSLFKEEPFFQALMLNSMMALTKTNFNLTKYMEDDAEFSEFWNILYEECELSIKMLLEISGLENLMENEVVSRESIKIRENIVLPLLVIQQNALYQIIQDSEFKELYEKIVTRSLYGNINASRNSA